MSKMAELEYEQRMAADQPRPTLSEAAQAVIDRWESPQWTHDAIHTGELIFALREALREDALEYELIGCINGTHAGRWLLWAENAAAVWPDGTAVYVRRIKK
jgi:hypothetical protein